MSTAHLAASPPARRRPRGGVRNRIRLLDARKFPRHRHAACLLDSRDGAVLDADRVPASGLRLALLGRIDDRLALRIHDPGDGHRPFEGSPRRILEVAGPGVGRAEILDRRDLCRVALDLATLLRDRSVPTAISMHRLAAALRGPEDQQGGKAEPLAHVADFRGRDLANPAAAVLRARGLIPRDFPDDPRAWHPRRLDALIDRLADADCADPGFRPGLLDAMRGRLSVAPEAVDDEDLLAAIAAPHRPLQAASVSRPFLVAIT
ncbi:hypothetical protein EP7_005583 (plasmid) [Isosphaeraceae bacterium EP7]